jgi:hypothetical protein
MTFPDLDWQNPMWAELIDATDQVQMAAEYEYEFHERGNWVKRSVWIWTRESGERKLHEIDSRKITCWK